MKKIYILFEGVNAVKSAKVHGGGNFSRWITKELKTSIENGKYEGIQLSILWPKGVQPQTKEERAIYEDAFYEIEETEALLNVPFCEGDILFVPVLESCHADFKLLRRKFPFLRIKMVIHGMRNLDLLRYDSYQKYYHKWYRPVPCMGILSFARQVKCCIKEINLVKRACQNADEVYTDSNCSLQHIIKYGKPKFIRYYHPASIIQAESNAVQMMECNSKYILFISANRNEKNAIRSLVAFCKYKLDNSDDNLKFYATGATETFKRALKHVKGIVPCVLEKSVVFFDYISSEQLLSLFKHCYFFLYPSKSEGYGLPLLDAMEAEKPVVASRITSVPEVLGSTAYYINPYSTESIVQGIAFMNNADNNEFYCKLMRKVKPLVHMRQEIDKAVLVNDIIGL